MDTPEPIISVENSLKTPKLKKNVIVIKRQALTTKKAVELLLNGTLKSKVCRFCLCITAPLSELDQIMQIAGKGALYKVTIKDIIASVHPFKVPADPNFPNKICEKCLNKALQSYLFAQKCEQSGRALRNCFEDMYEKLDKLDPIERVKKRGRQKLHPNHNILYAENRNVVDYAQPIHNLINISSVSFTNEPLMHNLECKKCWQVLPNVESLANHEKIHPKSMWFNCRICGKAFAKKIHIKRHLKIHAKGNVASIDDKESKFVCKQCGHSSDDHNVHLQHIEKHKFQTVLEHLVERKMDKLCSVCLSGNGKMIEMDKMICLHGGYPELTGDRSLYNILGATIPEKNYKYQELIVPQKSTITTITKRTNRVESVTTQIDFIFSPPKIISLNKDSYSKVYVFEFSEPIDLLQAKQLNIDMLEGTINLEEKDNDISNYDTNSTRSADSDELYDFTEINCSNDPIVQDTIEVNNFDENYNDDSKEEKSLMLVDDFDKSQTNDFNEINMKSLFTFSEPDYIIDFKEILQTTSNEAEENYDTEKLCAKCWIFKKPTCDKCSKHSDIDNDLLNNFATSESCQYCWIFKLVGKCNYCKKPAENIQLSTEQNELTIKNSVDTNIGIDTLLNMKKVQKRKLQCEDVVTPKKAKWQCKICLTANDSDRETCQCCQSEKVYDESVKIKMNYKFFEFMGATATEKNRDINQNDVEYKPSDTLSPDLIEPVKNEELCQIIESSIEMMESSDSIPEINKKNNNNLIFKENLEMAVEEDSISTILPKIQEPSHIMAEDDISFDSMSTEPSSPFIQATITSYPNPFSFGALPIHHPPQNDYQFRFGSMHSENKLNNIKNIRKSVKKLKSIRK
ncbi:hypothetical protein O0L34_g10266 [Tuta absoluta]|nr:hypothetical protein O0L34_g10266 [Tuta absoluta]